MLVGPSDLQSIKTIASRFDSGFLLLWMDILVCFVVLVSNGFISLVFSSVPKIHITIHTQTFIYMYMQYIFLWGMDTMYDGIATRHFVDCDSLRLISIIC